MISSLHQKHLPITYILFVKLQNLDVPNHWMAEFFHAQAELEVQMTEEALRRYDNLCMLGFEKSLYVKQQMALAYYNLRSEFYVLCHRYFNYLQIKIHLSQSVQN